MRRGQRSPGLGIHSAQFAAPSSEQQRAPAPALARMWRLVVSPAASDVVVLADDLPCRRLGPQDVAASSRRPFHRPRSCSVVAPPRHPSPLPRRARSGELAPASYRPAPSSVSAAPARSLRRARLGKELAPASSPRQNQRPRHSSLQEMPRQSLILQERPRHSSTLQERPRHSLLFGEVAALLNIIGETVALLNNRRGRGTPC